jgi:acetylornithine deacetylase/succinyl-diaminopimelate desuccinylase-like protein
MLRNRWVSPTDVAKELTEFPTYEEHGMRDCAQFLSEELADLGFNVRLDEVNNVFAEKRFDHRVGAFLINTHFDTVPSSAEWTKDPLKATLEGDRLYGLGTSDAKGGIAAALSTLARLENSRFGKLEVLFSNYEDNSAELDGETWRGTEYFLTHNHLDAISGINVEGTVKDGKFMISLGCGGRVGFEITTIGKQAHSSDPRLGRNAIYDMLKVIEALRCLPPAKMTLDDYEAYTELNVSKIEGGIAMNIVPPRCRIICERRVLPNESWDEVKKEVDNALSTLTGIDYRTEFHKPQRSYLLERTHSTVTLLRESASEILGYEPKFKVGSGRTDSIYFNQIAGIKTVIFGPGEKGHAPDESVSVKRLEEFSRVLHRMLSA